MRWRKLVWLLRLVFGVSTVAFLTTQLRRRLAVADSAAEDEGWQAARWTTQSAAALALANVDVRASVEYVNAHANVLNEERFGPAADAAIVIVIQVHDRANYLKQLISSLCTAVGIERALLIFSHDYFDPVINSIVQQINCSRVMQIFYPFSIQLYPDKFPGDDPRDCPPTISKDDAEKLGCLNWRSSDKYGHYRVAKITQIKHHWWWKMNFVFHGIPQLRTFNDYVLLLEEDHFVSPDFLHVFSLIERDKQSLCAECGMVALGCYLKSYGAYVADVDKLAVYPWFSSRHNLGMALERRTWQRLHNCSQLFCSFDDYNWDWSLMRVNTHCLAQRLQVLYAKAPRVFHIGDCGVHHKCTADTSARKVADVLTAARDSLFPQSLSVAERSKRTLKPPKENGGWADARDHALCLNNTRWSAYLT